VGEGADASGAPLDIASLGEDLPLLDGLRSTRAIRRLKPDPVPAALVRKVCEAGTFAPSGGNRQPWVFVAVMEAERRVWVAERYRKAWSKYTEVVEASQQRRPASEAQQRNFRAATHLAEHLHEAPVHLFIAGWTRRGAPQTQALFPCAQNILLACRAVGLGASLTTIHTMFGREVDEYLGLDADKTPSCALLPIGWPLGKYGRPPRKSVDEVLHFDRFDASRSRA